MGRIRNRVAVVATTAGLAAGFGSYTADIMTCPGEVKSTSGDVPVTYCDENPGSDNILNNPGTVEQKIAFGGFLIATLGGGAIALGQRRDP